MKLVSRQTLLRVGDFYLSRNYEIIKREIDIAISKVTWGHDTEFVINPVRRGNGVTTIKQNFVKYLVLNGWRDEVRTSIVEGVRPGPIDVIKETSSGIVAVEWETGNISSSHRALNKLAVGILQNQIVAGILVLPYKELAHYLTDRVGNFEELSPYFPLYSNLIVKRGLIEVIGVTFDRLSENVELISKGKDGNAEK